MSNIFRKHYQSTLARQAAEAAAGLGKSAAAQPDAHDAALRSAANNLRADGSGGILRAEADAAQRLMLSRLTADRSRLKMIQSVQAKIAAKKEMLPEYEAWVEGTLQAADQLPEGVPNDTLTTIMMWRMDAQDFEGALRIAEAVLARKIPLPAWFERQAACAIAEEMAEAAFSALRDKAPFDLDHIVQTQLLTEAEDMPDEVRAKMHKAVARLTERTLDDLEETKDEGAAARYPAALDHALEEARKALALHSKSGVTTLIRSLEKRQKQLAAEREKAAAPTDKT